MKILIIDDNQINLDIARAQLGKDHEVTISNIYQRDYSGFDVVLLDLLMPVEAGGALGPTGMKHVGHETPVGIFMTFCAVLAGAKYVAVFTDANHHDHPASSFIDKLNQVGTLATPYSINGTKVMFFNHSGLMDYFDPADLSKPLDYNEARKYPNKILGKDWATVLAKLLK